MGYMKKSIIGGEIKLKNSNKKSTKKPISIKEKPISIKEKKGKSISIKEKPISLNHNKHNQELLINDIIKKWYIFKEISNDNTIKDEKWLSYLLRDHNSLKLYKNYFSKLVPEKNYDKSILKNQNVIDHIEDIKKKIVEPRLLLEKYLGINYNNNNNRA